jgi:hypothetical protein
MLLKLLKFFKQEEKFFSEVLFNYIEETLSYTVKKAFRYSRPQPEFHLPNSL